MFDRVSKWRRVQGHALLFEDYGGRFCLSELDGEGRGRFCTIPAC